MAPIRTASKTAGLRQATIGEFLRRPKPVKPVEVPVIVSENCPIHGHLKTSAAVVQAIPVQPVEDSDVSEPEEIPVVVIDDDEPPVPSPPPAKKIRRNPPLQKGKALATFNGTANWDMEWPRTIGTGTKEVRFGGRSVLNDEHIEQIVALGPRVCKNLARFKFIYSDVSYDAQNDARDITDAAIISFASACPNLTKFELPCSKLKDESLIALFSNCPNLTHVEVTGGGARGNVRGDAFNALRDNEAWAPLLKKLIVANNTEDKVYMKAMRELGRARPDLVIELADISEEKKWGDWVLVRDYNVYKKGRLSGQRHSKIG